MKRFAVVLLLAAATLQAQQEQHPTVAKGVDPNKMYQFGDVDSVNVFNGNVMVRLPIGQGYPVGRSFSYQLTLSYNSKVWDTEVYTDNISGSKYTVTIPDRGSDAGFGWNLSPGRMLPLEDPNGTLDRLVYIDSTGSRHEFSIRLHDEDQSQFYDCTASPPRRCGITGLKRVLYSHDGNYLRLRIFNDGTRAVDFPDGAVHTFNTAGRLVNARDAFGNHYDIQYVLGSDGLVDSWTLTDQFNRTQTVTYTTWANSLVNYKRVPATVRLTAFTSPGSPAAFTEYSFQYENASIPRGCGNEYSGSPYGSAADVPLLKSITLPDGSKYSFDYHRTSTPCPSGQYCPMGGNCDQGTIASVQFPTGGTRKFDYQQYMVAMASCNLDGTYYNSVFFSNTPGIKTRSDYRAGATTPSATWSYELSREGSGEEPKCNGQFPGETERFDEELQVAVTFPGGRKTVHYFSVWPGQQPSPNGFDSREFGYPFTSMPAKKAPKRNVAEPDRKLSTADFEGGVRKRSSYVLYEGLLGDVPRVMGSRTLFDDDAADGGPHYVDVASSDYDGYGHYRKTVTTSSFPGSLPRTSIMRYNPLSTASGRAAGSATLLIDPALTTVPWILGKYERTTTAEGLSGFATDVCFDSDGFLLGRRVYKNATVNSDGSVTPVPSDNDVVSSFSKASSANIAGSVESERWFGGDIHPLAAGYSNLCSAPSGSHEYAIDYSYAYGVMNSATYRGQLWKSVDFDIDSRTGLVATSREPNLLATTFTYDTSGRLTTINPTGRARSEFVYVRASGMNPGESFTPAALIGSQCYLNQAPCPLTQTLSYFDDFGRVVQSKTMMPEGWSTVRTQYDALGRVERISMPEYRAANGYEASFSPSFETTTVYDAFDRPTRVVSPDGTSVDFTYTGERKKERKTGVSTGVDGDPQVAGIQDTRVSVFETSDGYGRLISVKEKSGPTSSSQVEGGDVTTSYTYDAANRLTSVTMTPQTGPVQKRRFDFDGRGFLRWEDQPESGITSFEYDCRGHLMSKSPAAANSQFDLKFTYDAAERLTRVDGRNPLWDPNGSQPQFRPLKEYVFGSANVGSDLKLGKLASAIRHNYPDSGSEPEYEVRDDYKYLDSAGRRTHRLTTITEVIAPTMRREAVREIPFSVSYTPLDMPQTITYPKCEGCGLPSTLPDRAEVGRTYAAGKLTSVTGLADSITYWPTGMRNVLQHSNGIADTQAMTNMPRTSSIAFGRYDRCVRPSFTVQPLSGEVGSDGTFMLSVTANGTGPLKYEWWNETTGQQLSGTGSSISVAPTSTTTYYVVVTNPCGVETSQRAKVSARECPAPTLRSITAVAQPDGSWILKPDVMARQRSYQWTIPPSTNVVATTETMAVVGLTATTTYRLTIQDACGTSYKDITIVVPPPITNGLVASRVASSNQVLISWPAIPGATVYTLQRRSGSTWEPIATTATLSYTDSVAASRTYAYRVISLDNFGSTNADVATTMSFVAAEAGQPVADAPINGMLSAVNSVRAAAGWPALTWSNILAAGDPLPASGFLVMARHITACRARMNEALQALGVRVGDYATPELMNVVIGASTINEVQQRAQ